MLAGPPRRCHLTHCDRPEFRRDVGACHLFDFDRGRELLGVAFRLEAAFLRLRPLRRSIADLVPPGHEWVVDILDVEETIRQACRRWQVREIAADPYGYRRSYKILEDEGLPIVDYPQSAALMTPATQAFREAVMNHGLTHSGDPRLARHISNAVLKVDSRGQRIAKDQKGSSRKIDLAVSAIMALDRASAVPPTYNLLDSVW